MNLETESDVEQKFIAALLTKAPPHGLGYSWSDIKTKKDIRALKIDKGKSEKIYYPDYVILYNGMPLVVVEVKKPKEDLGEAYREARLYASEINASYPSKLNPCSTIIVSNGEETMAGNWDSDSTIAHFYTSSLSPTDPSFFYFCQKTRQDVIFRQGSVALQKLRGKAKYIKPTQMLGGRGAQEEELKENSFGSAISIEFRNIFNPQSPEDRNNVVKEAYVPTKKLTKHIQPIERIIRNTLPVVNREITTIEDTSNPREITNAIIKHKDSLKNQLLLLIGNVGAGKSTFTDYLREIALKNELGDSTEWISVNMNNANLDRSMIYNWIEEEIIGSIERNHREIDFEDLDLLENIYSVEYNRAKKWGEKLFGPGKQETITHIYQEILKLEQSVEAKAKAYTRYFSAERNKLLIVVLDNCDKRNAEDQLLMFDVANWLRERFSCLVFLPMRDTTYDSFRKEKPLDTVIKDLVFRIEPPLLRSVINERVKYALRILGSGKKVLKYDLSDSIRVEYQQSDLEIYLNSILRSLFQSTYFNTLISGISGRDIRKGLEIFLDFCRSGHIQESEVFKMKKFPADYTLKDSIISRVMIHGNFKYYQDSVASVKNVFFSEPGEDDLPNPFTRLFILTWLEDRYYEIGPNGTRGFHKATDLISDLITFGHSRDRIESELAYFASIEMIITEALRHKIDFDSDLVCITSYGHIHLELLKDLNYLAACSEDTFYRENQVASSIYQRISGKVGQGHYSLSTTIFNSGSLIDYLKDFAQKFLFTNTSSFFNSQDYTPLYNLENSSSILARIKKSIESNQQRLLPEKTRFVCEIVSIQNYGAFVHFEVKERGLIHVSEFSKKRVLLDDFEPGDFVEAEIIRFSVENNRYNLSFIRKLDKR